MVADLAVGAFVVLFSVENSDAQGARWPRGKVHDDATVIFCEPDSREAMG
jgi:hypothetical protein